MPEKTKESIPEGPGRAVRLRVPRQEKVGAGRPASAMQVRLVSSPSISSRTPFLVKQILLHDRSNICQLKDIWQYCRQRIDCFPSINLRTPFLVKPKIFHAKELYNHWNMATYISFAIQFVKLTQSIKTQQCK